ncbi:MAG: hypothetical protein JEY71_11245 [Sphaerochaeta sp.]|nr:hypothetical protein [Sphaerochaeta sp.]
MNRHSILSILVLLLVFLLGSPLFASDLVATYTEEIDTTIATSNTFGVGAPNYSLAFHVGTLAIQKIGGGWPSSFYYLLLNHSGSLNNPLTLVSNRPIGGISTFNAQLVAKVQHNSSTQIVVLGSTAGQKALINSVLGSYPITIDFYVLIAGIPAVEQVAGAHFQFATPPGGTLGDFTLESRYSFLWFQFIEDIEIDGSNSPVPFFMTDYSSGSPNYININSVDPTVYASLNIEQTPEQATISLFDAAGSNKKKVGVARITLSGFQSTDTYGVSISFTDGNGSTTPQFRLKHADFNTYIPFNLKLNNQPIENGVPVTWNNLSYGINNTKNLNVTGIDYATAQTSISGLYSDDIYVTITPLDTNLVGL